MSDPDAYVMLISSFPSSEKLFLAKRPPLSRLKLRQRLRTLPPEHAATLQLVDDALNWGRLPITASDADVIARGRAALSQIKSETLRAIVLERLELRTAVSALRRRAHGEGPPADGAPWGFGRWVGHIVRNWSEPGFGLDRVFPWLREADGLLRADDPVGLERLILDQAQRLLQRHAAFHTFDFEAVVIYVLKWNIFDRWARANGTAAIARFDDMTAAGLGAFAELSFEESA
ncbi:hypothetical protein [Bauldia sp.]|uniref:hypothetical protein n=1 Tax=Bauldia sp. TaxID=2575872 RepID=UPI003BAAB957